MTVNEMLLSISLLLSAIVIAGTGLYAHYKLSGKDETDHDKHINHQ
jgi:hypothetical protein